MKEILIATNNLNKLKEFQEMATPNKLQLKSLKDYASFPETVENGLTFKENAYLKAKDAFVHTRCPSLADDSGLEVEALNNQPGVFSKRYSSLGSDEANNLLLLQNLKGKSNRNARFVCVLCYIEDLSHVEYFYGVVEGVILEEPVGSNGFGYDPIFFIREAGCTMAEASVLDKNRYSHRGRAFKAFLKSLEIDNENSII